MFEIPIWDLKDAYPALFILNVTMPTFMQIYLMRHADAVSSSDWDGSDMDRPLADFGKKRLTEALPFIAKHQLQVATLVTSPYKRAKETMHIISGIFPSAIIVQSPHLSSGARADAIKSAVLHADVRLPALFIGHMPDLAVFASRATGVIELLDGSGFEPGEIMCLETGPLHESWMQGKIIWRHTLPEWKTLP